MLTRYPFDPTGKSPDNSIQGESHALDDNFPQLIIPRYSAFYHGTMEVYYQGQPLELNKDWQYTLFSQEDSHETGLAVSLGIHIVRDDLTGEVVLNYQTVGGRHQVQNEALIQWLLEEPHHNTLKTYWDDVLEKPDAFIPTRHFHDIDDVFGISIIIPVLQDIRKTLENVSVVRLKSVYDRFFKLKQYVEATLQGYENVQSQFDSLVSDIEFIKENAVTIDVLNNNVDNKINEYDKTVERRLTDVKNTINEKEKALRQAINNVADKIPPLVNAISEIRSDMTTMEGNLRNEIKTESTKLEGKINTKLGELKEETSRLIEESEGRSNEKLTDLNEKINDARTDIEYLDDRLGHYYQENRHEIDVLERNLTLTNSKLTELSEEARTTEGALRDSLNALTNDLNAVKQNQETEHAELRNDINNLTQTLNETINTEAENNKALEAKIEAAKEAIGNELNTLSESTQSSLDDINQQMGTLSNTLDDVKATADNNATEISNTKGRLDEVLESVGTIPTEDEVAKLVKQAIDQRIAESRENVDTGNDDYLFDPSTLIIHPDTDSGVVDDPELGLTVHGIVYMDRDNSTREDFRHVFTPTTCLEWTKNARWTVPDIFDLLVAQVFVTTATRPHVRQPGDASAFLTPSTKVGYVLLKGGMTVDITVGPISSFGSYVTNDGLNQQGVIIPSIPIVTNQYGSGGDMDIRTYFGKGGKVLIYV